MITPATMISNLADKATGWQPVTCSHEELVELVKKIFIKGQPAENLDDVKQISKGSFWNGFTLKTPDEQYIMYIEAAAGSKGRLVTIRDNETKKVYKKDYLLLRKFAAAVAEECEKELQNPTVKFSDHPCEDTNTNGCFFCPQCGTRCEARDVYCKECGNLLREDEAIS